VANCHPRIVLGAIFTSAALSYFWSLVFSWALLPVTIAAQAMQPSNRLCRRAAPADYRRNPLVSNLSQPVAVSVATTVLAVICELMLLRAYASRYNRHVHQ
jgi:hypothetical protein